ncbi:AAA family ATPase [Streptomyces sp. NPDC047009]|uniref:helix-turn-helix transcriptional regulator n=1 Tax=Streptomyces sp. NPDC047009 TaxID=3154496 RepID=UPI0033F0BFA0
MDGVRSPDFVGRDVEQRWLQEALARPSTRLVVIEGEAGIGKSRFIEETMAAAAGTGDGVLLLRCPPVATPFPLGTLVDALGPTPPDPHRLGRLAGALRPLFPEWWDILPEPLPPAESGALERHRLFRAFTELVRTLGAHTVVLDDAHWADDATHEFLLHLATVDGDAPVRVVETWRTEERPDAELVARILRIAAGGTGRVISLGPLDLAGTGKFVASMLRGPLASPRVVDLLHQRTQGVPLMLEDLVRTVQDLVRANPGEVHWSPASIAALAPPASLRESVATRMERLTPATRPVAWALAVLAESAGVPLLATVAGLDHQATSTALDELVEAHLVSLAESGDVSFRHALVLNAVADQVPLGVRSRLHARAAAALSALPAPPVVRLARHLKLSGDVAGWARYAEQVADLALSRADDLTAATILLELATVTVQRPADLTRIVAKIPFAVFRSIDQYRVVEDVLRRVAEDPALSRLDQGRVRWQLARVLILEGRMSEAAEETQRAVPLLADEPLLAGQAMINTVHLSWPTWSSATRQAWLQQAARLLQDRDPASELRLTSDLATVLLRFGSADGWREAAKIPTRDIEVRDRLNAARALGNIGHCALIWGRYATARTALSSTFDLANTYDYPVVSATLEDSILHLDYLEGSWKGLRERAAALVAAARSVGSERLEVEVVEARLLIAGGKRDEARTRLRAVLEHPVSQLGPELVMEARAALAEVALADGDPEAALTLTQEPFSLIERTGVWLWGTELVPTRVRALLLTGRKADARDVVTAMAAGIGAGNAPAADAALLSCRAMLAQVDRNQSRARELHLRAAAGWRELPCPHEELRDLEAAAHCLPETAQQEADAELHVVRHRYAQLGAVVHGERLAASRTAQTSQRRGRKGYGTRLSPAELEVVRLVAAGETNRAIAAKLFKSPNTVQSQVRSAKHKLGLSTRAELARTTAYLTYDEDA